LRLAAILVALAASLSTAGVAQAAHGPGYRGSYANAFVAGRTADGREVAVLGGPHTDFPYHDPGSGYDQVAVLVGEREAIVRTGRPKLAGFALELGERQARLTYSDPTVAFDLTFAAVRQTPRYYGDPDGFGDLFLQAGVRSDQSPGFVYTPYQLVGLEHGSLVVAGKQVALASLHGQAEEGQIEAPADPRFRSAYDYLAAPSLEGPPYTYMAFATRALHSGVDGALDPYLRSTGSDEFTLEGGTIATGNPHAAPGPFDNTRALPGGSRKLGQWAVDLGPGILWRKLVRVADGSGRPLLALSESIKEEPRTGLDAQPPVISRARARRGRVSFTLSEPALVHVRSRRGELRTEGNERGTSLRLPRRLRPRRGRRVVILTATDEAGNRSRPARLRVKRPAQRGHRPP
jgi:hypothetical protein